MGAATATATDPRPLPCDLAWARPEALGEVRAPGRALTAVDAVGRLSSGEAPLAHRAQRALEALVDFAPADAAVLDAWNPVRGRHEPLAAIGAPPEVPGVEGVDQVLRDPGYRYVRARRVPHRRCDVPHAERNPMVVDICAPHGFREGVTACLFEGGRYTGMLNLGLVEPRPLEAWRMTLLSVAASSLGRLADLTRRVDGAELALEPDAPAALVHADGRVEPLPGRPRSPLLVDGGALTVAARRHAPRGPGSAAFLWADADADTLWRVAVLRAGPAGAAGTMLVSIEPSDTALSVRELEVLAHVADGLPNAAIATRLRISPHTVARHVEHILDKLGVTGRVEAAVCAVREGLILAFAER